MPVSLKNKIRTIIQLLKNPSQLNALISLKHSGYLNDLGWFEAFKSKTPVDKNGNPIPWFTYSCNQFISDRLNKKMVVAEFGSGNSTLFMAQRVKEVYSIEHNIDWFNNVVSNKMTNINLMLSTSDNEVDYITKFLLIDKNIDLIVVDGIHRNKCIETAITKLSDNGVIILDDSERKEYFDGINLLLKNNFKRIDFYGIAPGLLYSKCTTIFYKQNNCLGI